MINELFVGIDVAKAWLDVALSSMFATARVQKTESSNHDDLYTCLGGHKIGG